MRQAVEEAIPLHYMLRCLGIPVTNPTNLYGDNFGSIQSASNPECIYPRQPQQNKKNDNITPNKQR